MVAAVAQRIEIPLIVGGGIRSGDKAYNICRAGADIIVVGNAIEKESSLIVEISDAVHAHNRESSLLRPAGN
jgi:putative glycerol-1-phosphate prenyltransferase